LNQENQHSIVLEKCQRGVDPAPMMTMVSYFIPCAQTIIAHYSLRRPGCRVGWVWNTCVGFGTECDWSVPKNRPYGSVPGLEILPPILEKLLCSAVALRVIQVAELSSAFHLGLFIAMRLLTGEDDDFGCWEAMQQTDRLATWVTDHLSLSVGGIHCAPLLGEPIFEASGIELHRRFDALET